MLFLSKDGKYVEVLRKNYSDDVSYYTDILKIKTNYSEKVKKEYRIFH
jgi:hypothetical protein